MGETRRSGGGRPWTALALLLVLAGCTTTPAEKTRLETTALRAGAHATIDARVQDLNGLQSRCEPLRSGGQTPWTSAAACYDRQLIASFDAGDAPYRSWLYINIAQRENLAMQVDRAKITPAEGRARMAELDRNLASQIRATLVPPALTPLQQEHSKEVAVHDELLQRQADTERLIKAFETIQPPP